jgi:hypothetical protein
MFKSPSKPLSKRWVRFVRMGLISPGEVAARLTLV